MPRTERRPPQRAMIVNGPERKPLVSDGPNPFLSQRQAARPADAPPKRLRLQPDDPGAGVTPPADDT